MIYEEAGLPHYAPGGSVLSSGGQQLFKNLSKKLTGVLGRAPTAQELHQLEQEIHALAKPTSTMEGANLARVAKQEPHPDMFADTEGRLFPRTSEGTMPTPRQRQYTAGQLQGPPLAGEKYVANSNYAQAFDPRDEFITQMNTGRGNRGTWLHASPEANAADEAGLLDDMYTDTPLGGHPQQSVTPANDYLAQLADVMQAAGKEHDYTGMGAAVYGNRPSFGAGTLTKQQKAELEAWREQARAAGIPESAIISKPSQLGRQFQYLEEERSLGPTGPESRMAQGGPVQHFLSGGSALTHATYAAPSLHEVPGAVKAARTGNYAPAMSTGLDIAQAMLPFTPAFVAPQLALYSPELGDSTIEGFKRQEAERKAAREAAVQDQIRRAQMYDYNKFKFNK